MSLSESLSVKDVENASVPGTGPPLPVEVTIVSETQGTTVPESQVLLFLRCKLKM